MSNTSGVLRALLEGVHSHHKLRISRFEEALRHRVHASPAYIYALGEYISIGLLSIVGIDITILSLLQFHD